MEDFNIFIDISIILVFAAIFIHINDLIKIVKLNKKIFKIIFELKLSKNMLSYIQIKDLNSLDLELYKVLYKLSNKEIKTFYGVWLVKNDSNKLNYLVKLIENSKKIYS